MHQLAFKHILNLKEGDVLKWKCLYLCWKGS